MSRLACRHSEIDFAQRGEPRAGFADHSIEKNCARLALYHRLDLRQLKLVAHAGRRWFVRHDDCCHAPETADRTLHLPHRPGVQGWQVLFQVRGAPDDAAPRTGPF